MVSWSRPTLRFPRVRRVALRDFSLFTRRQEISLELEEGVFCLAGANGLGKSTFVAAVNFGITGRVPDPERRFESVEEYYQYTEDFSEGFFSGRIAEMQRESAEVELELSVGDTTYRITRGMFEPNQLRALEIIDGSATAEPAPSHINTLSRSEMHELFAEHFTKRIGLQSFPQFVFLQLFLLTFDERRNLAFWDSRVLERILFLAFGVDPGTADRADVLRRRYERYDSRVRNTQWQATQLRDKLKDLEQYLGRAESDEDLSAQYDALVDKHTVLREKVDRLRSELQDSQLRFAELSSQYVTLQKEYEDAFAARASRQHGVRFHPFVVDSFNDNRCSLCGTAGDEAISRLEERVSRNECPLCGSVLAAEAEQSDSGLDALRAIDVKMSKTKKKIATEDRAIKRLSSELDTALGELQEVDQAVADFEAENEAFSAEQAAKASGVEDVAKSYKLRVQELLDRKEEARRARDKVKAELRQLQRSLNEGYQNAEADFVPKFRELAQAFLGLDFDVRLETRSGQIGLVLEVGNQGRRLRHHLSESQRFFVDIALRMALAQLMSSGQDRATMLIDTPEGSLDSAYEKRAGEMFARFVDAGYHIVMTANINTSQLLLRLAERCGRTKMKLSRMTEWTDLSEVQIQEESLFERAFSAIEESLELGSA